MKFHFSKLEAIRALEKAQKAFKKVKIEKDGINSFIEKRDKLDIATLNLLAVEKASLQSSYDDMLDYEIDNHYQVTIDHNGKIKII